MKHPSEQHAFSYHLLQCEFPYIAMLSEEPYNWVMSQIIRSPQALGEAIRRARRAAGLTQRELGARTNLRQATISGLENGEGATLDTMFAVLTVLKLELQVQERTTASPALDDLF